IVRPMPPKPQSSLGMKRREQRSAKGSLAYQRCEHLDPEMITDREFVGRRDSAPRHRLTKHQARHSPCRKWARHGPLKMQCLDEIAPLVAHRTDRHPRVIETAAVESNDVETAHIHFTVRIGLKAGIFQSGHHRPVIWPTRLAVHQRQNGSHSEREPCQNEYDSAGWR